MKTITQFQNRDRQFHCFSHLIQFQKITRYRRHWNNWNGFFIQSFPTERYVECGQKLVDVFSQFQSNQAIQIKQLLGKEYIHLHRYKKQCFHKRNMALRTWRSKALQWGK